MKITRLETILLTGPATNDPYLSECRKRRSAAFIEVHTDTEHVGLGETYAGYFCPELIPRIVSYFEPILVGRDVGNIDRMWQDMYRCEKFWGRVGVGAAALTGIEAALWDLKGKITGLPVYELLGGRKHDALDCYASGGPSNFPMDHLAKKIESYLALGFNAVKLGAGWFHQATTEGRGIPDGWVGYNDPQQWVDCEAGKLEFVRERFGKDIGVMLDGHMDNNPCGQWDVGTAKAVARAIEPYNVGFLEEPLPYTDPWGYSELCKSTTVPIAGGECLTTTYEWRVFVDQDAFDIGQPDASFTGGLGEFMRVAAMLESRGRKVATHSWGAGASLMQNIHAGFAAANTCILEIPPDYGPLHSEVIGDSFVLENGRVLPPTGVGLGIRLTDATKAQFPFVPGSGEFNDVPGKVLTD